MLLPLILMQASSLVAPLYLDEQPPELRAVRAILVLHRDVPGVSVGVTRSRDEAAEVAAQLRGQLAEGADFATLAREHSGHQSAVYGGVLGSYAPGILWEQGDEFLFAAEPGAISEPIESAIGFQILQRIDPWAGCLHILLQGDGAQRRARELIEQLEAGADFRELAREHSDDPLGRERSGEQAIFLRGPSDSLVKEAAFSVGVGEWFGPLESALGVSIGMRVAPEEIDPSLRDESLGRLRAILLQAQDGRDMDLSEAFAKHLAERIRAGESMAELASLYDDDPGGRERAGDLGWVLRRSSKLRPVVERAFAYPRGELIGPLKLHNGWLLLRRER